MLFMAHLRHIKPDFLGKIGGDSQPLDSEAMPSTIKLNNDESH